MIKGVLFGMIFWDSFIAFLAGGGLDKTESENILQLPDLDNASVGKKETTETPVITGVFFIGMVCTTVYSLLLEKQ